MAELEAELHDINLLPHMHSKVDIDKIDLSAYGEPGEFDDVYEKPKMHHGLPGVLGVPGMLNQMTDGMEAIRRALCPERVRSNFNQFN